MWRVMVSVCLFTGVLGFETTPVDQCLVQNGDLPLNVHVKGCETPPCEFRQLEYANLNLVFPAPRTIRSMKTSAYAIVFGIIGTNYDLGPESVGCNYITNSYCPIMAGEVITYTLNMYIESWFPAGTSATVEFYIEDENSLPVVCFRVPIRILRAEAQADAEETKVKALEGEVEYKEEKLVNLDAVVVNKYGQVSDKMGNCKEIKECHSKCRCPAHTKDCFRECERDFKEFSGV